MAKREVNPSVQRRTIRSEKDMKQLADELFPERIVERNIKGDFFISPDELDDTGHPGHPSNYGDN